MPSQDHLYMQDARKKKASKFYCRQREDISELIIYTLAGLQSWNMSAPVLLMEGADIDYLYDVIEGNVIKKQQRTRKRKREK